MLLVIIQALSNFLLILLENKKNTNVASTEALVRTTIHTKRKKYKKIDNRIKQMVKDYNNDLREDYFKMTRSVFNF